MEYDDTWNAVLIALENAGGSSRASILREVASDDGTDLYLALGWAKADNVPFTEEIAESVKALVANGELESEALTLIQ